MKDRVIDRILLGVLIIEITVAVLLGCANKKDTDLLWIKHKIGPTQVLYEFKDTGVVYSPDFGVLLDEEGKPITWTKLQDMGG